MSKLLTIGAISRYRGEKSYTPSPAPAPPHISAISRVRSLARLSPTAQNVMRVSPEYAGASPVPGAAMSPGTAEVTRWAASELASSAPHAVQARPSVPTAAVARYAPGEGRIATLELKTRGSVCVGMLRGVVHDGPSGLGFSHSLILTFSRQGYRETGQWLCLYDACDCKTAKECGQHGVRRIKRQARRREDSPRR